MLKQAQIQSSKLLLVSGELSLAAAVVGVPPRDLLSDQVVDDVLAALRHLVGDGFASCREEELVDYCKLVDLHLGVVFADDVLVDISVSRNLLHAI